LLVEFVNVYCWDRALVLYDPVGEKALITTPEYGVMVCLGVGITLEEVELHAVGCAEKHCSILLLIDRDLPNTLCLLFARIG
jgi:hypothetical protein